MWAVGAAGCYLPHQHATRQVIVRITAIAVQLTVNRASVEIRSFAKVITFRCDHLPLECWRHRSLPRSISTAGRRLAWALSGLRARARDAARERRARTDVHAAARAATVGSILTPRWRLQTTGLGLKLNVVVVGLRSPQFPEPAAVFLAKQLPARRRRLCSCATRPGADRPRTAAAWKPDARANRLLVCHRSWCYPQAQCELRAQRCRAAATEQALAHAGGPQLCACVCGPAVARRPRGHEGRQGFEPPAALMKPWRWGSSRGRASRAVAPAAAATAAAASRARDPQLCACARRAADRLHECVHGPIGTAVQRWPRTACRFAVGSATRCSCAIRRCSSHPARRASRSMCCSHRLSARPAL